MKILNKKTIQIAIPILLFSFLFSDKKIKTKTEIIYNVKEKYDEQTLIPKNKSIYKKTIARKSICVIFG